MNKAVALETLLTPTLVHLGYEWWGCSFVKQGTGRIIRIYIDGPEGVTVGACATVSKRLSAILKVEGELKEVDTLEISSPGVNRPLFTLLQYSRYVGSPLVVRLKPEAMDNRRQIRGVLDGVEEDKLLIKEKNGIVHNLLFQQVEQGKLTLI